MSDVLIKNLTFSFGDKSIFENLNLDIAQGERIALMGASGSGKTTLLRLIAGLLPPDYGSITADNESGVSFVFQENRLLPHLDLVSNITLISKDISRQKAAELLSEVGLSKDSHLLPLSLSGGMARRVAIVRAVAFKSGLLLLDEPFSGLDDDIKKISADFILNNLNGRTLILVTHDPSEAHLLGCRIVNIDGSQK